MEHSTAGTRGTQIHKDRAELVAVQLQSGLVVWHTAEEYARLMHGVDVEASHAAVAELELEDEPDAEM